MIEGKIAQIPDESTFIINVGADAGVKEGMRFAIVVPGDDVKDPDSGETLEKLEHVKGVLVANHVQKKITTCRALSQIEARHAQEDPSTRVLSAEMIAVSRLKREDEFPTLPVKRSDLAGTPTLSPVSVGDRIRSIGE